MPIHQQLLWTTAIVFVGGIILRISFRHYAVNNGKTAYLSFGAAGGSYNKKMGEFVDHLTEILMPVGAGLYPLRLTPEKRKEWENIFYNWIVERKAEIRIFITNPSQESVAYWQDLASRFGERFTVFAVDGSSFDEEMQIEIRRLDLYHTVLALKDDKPFSMWIEGLHQAGETEAHAIEYVAQEDLSGEQAERFRVFEALLRRIIDRTDNDDNNDIEKKAA